jgi:hypothetical protein
MNIWRMYEASASLAGKSAFDEDFDFERIHAVIQSIHMRTWFLKIRVQQRSSLPRT